LQCTYRKGANLMALATLSTSVGYPAISLQNASASLLKKVLSIFIGFKLRRRENQKVLSIIWGFLYQVKY